MKEIIRVTDYIAQYIYSALKVDHVFMVSGGGMMFLSDGLALCKDIKVICHHHEQAAAMAAVSYSKQTEGFGVVYVTTGCGGTNTITGLLGAWQDNVPCIFISGQSKRKETVRNSNLSLRQFGVQEVDIIPIVSSLTKYSIMINDPYDIRYHLEKASFLANSGRKGPVWVDVPLDIQGAMIDPNTLNLFSKSEIDLPYKEKVTPTEIALVLDALNQASRPIIIAGQGIRLSKAIPEFKTFIEKLQIPYVASRLGIDLLASEHPLFIGRIGTKGDRAGNFAVQNADLVFSIGSRLSVSSTGHEYDQFARGAKTIVVDIDPIEHQKNTIHIDHFVNCDAKDILENLNKSFSKIKHNWDNWAHQCLEWKNKWPVCLPEYATSSNGVNIYSFVDILTRNMPDDATIISDAGSAFYTVSQGGIFRKTHRYITTGGQAEMGYTIPAAIGVAAAKRKGITIGITGDGSFQMNIQELQTIVHHQFPIKIFVLNNDGYLSIRATQAKFFEGRFIGTDSTSGVSFPNLMKIAQAYGIRYFKIEKFQDINPVVNETLSMDSPVLCEVICIRDQLIIPCTSTIVRKDGTLTGKPLEDMYPFLNRDEFNRNMIVKPLNTDIEL